MSNTKTSSGWERFKDLDLGELNDLNQKVFESRYRRDQSLVSTLSEIFSDHYSYDIMSGTGPYAAVVLEVLSGPQINNEASTRGGNKTKAINLASYSDPMHKEAADAGRRPPIKVIAKIPEFDCDIDWPKSKEDRARIDAHAEFHEANPGSDPKLENIIEGSIIWVQFSNTENTTGFNGKPAGKIIGLGSVGATADIRLQLSPKKAINPDCQSAVNLVGPAGGLLLGDTDPDPNEDIGPPIRKIKGHIKTGIYGNGTPQTKVHFDAALENSLISTKHQIEGPAPASNNAFIWIGTLKNNGYMDLLDRPIGQGRETIIYAPMTLDLTSPIEIKYYLHDQAGFGHAHINGPTTSQGAARLSGDQDGNDFKEKIGPAIKDLNKDGRNYVLVIPEMSYSRGFGTGQGGKDRLNKMAAGESPTPGGKRTGPTIRSKIGPNIKAAVKNYLTHLPIETTKNVLHITSLVERELSTFDGSFTGGKFGDFHQEVLDVLDEHLGTIYDKVGFVSIVADGLGSMALAAITKEVPTSAPHSAAEKSFKFAFDALPLRIDFITDRVYDSPRELYGYYFGGESPSYVFYKNFLQYRADINKYTEFNYITTPSDKKDNFLFDNLGKSKEFSTATDGSPKKASKEFSFPVQSGPSVTTIVSMHAAPKDTKDKKSAVGYAFSMINDSLLSFEGYPKKSDANSSLKPGLNEVPNHAYALSAKPSVSGVEKLQKRRDEYAESLNYFEELINGIVNPQSSLGDIDWVCTVPKYSAFCSNGNIKLDSSSLFYKEYRKYLEKKRKYMETFLLIAYEQDINKIINNKNELIKKKSEIKKDLDTNLNERQAKGWQKQWDSLLEKFNADLFTSEDSWIQLGSPDKGNLANLASKISAQEAHEKALSHVITAIDRCNPEKIQRLEDCDPQPKKMGEFTGDIPSPKESKKPGNNCSDIKVSVPSNFEELYSMIKYLPSKADFSYTGKYSKTKTKVHEVPGWRADTFKYPARAANGATTYKESPPVWACISQILKKGWEEASEKSKYYPYEITEGLRGAADPKRSGVSSYTSGMSLHSFGLAIDIDPFIAGYGKKTSVDSVFTGAWTPGFVELHGKDLYRLGVFKTSPSLLKNNAYEAANRPRMTENWSGAPSRYKGGGESFDAKEKYKKILAMSKGGPIVPMGSNPTEWLLLFCEKTGMRWGNAYFLKKNWRTGRRAWTRDEQEKISKIYGIPDVVNRIQAISWNTNYIDDHMHFHYWSAKSLVGWKQINKVREKEKK